MGGEHIENRTLLEVVKHLPELRGVHFGQEKSNQAVDVRQIPALVLILVAPEDVRKPSKHGRRAERDVLQPELPNLEPRAPQDGGVVLFEGPLDLRPLTLKGEGIVTGKSRRLGRALLE